MIAFNGIESAIYRLRSVNVPSPLLFVVHAELFFVWLLAIVLRPLSLSCATPLTVLIKGLLFEGLTYLCVANLHTARFCAFVFVNTTNRSCWDGFCVSDSCYYLRGLYTLFHVLQEFVWKRWIAEVLRSTCEGDLILVYIYICKRFQEKTLNNCQLFECNLSILKCAVISAVGLSLL